MKRTPRRVEERSLKRLFLSGATWSGVGTLGSAGLQLLVAAVVARRFGTAGFALFILVWSIVHGGAVFVALGLPPVVLRHVSGHLAVGTPLGAWRTVVRGNLLATGAAIILLGVLSIPPVRTGSATLFGEPRLVGTLLLAGVLLLLHAQERVLSDALRGFLDFPGAVLSNGLLSSLGLIIAIALGLGRTVEDVLLVWAVTSAASVAFGWLRCRSRYRRAIDGAVDHGAPPTPRALLRSGAPLMGSSALGMIFNYADVWIVAAVASSMELALYGAAGRLMLLARLPFTVLIRVADPLIAGYLARDDRPGIQRILRSVATGAAVLSLGVGAAYALGGRQILEGLYGTPYGDGIIILVVLAVGQVTHVLFGGCGSVLVQTGHEDLTLVASIATNPLTIVAAIVLGRWHGAVGVAVAVSAGLFLQNLLLWWFAYTRVRINTFADPRTLRHLPQLLRARRRVST